MATKCLRILFLAGVVSGYFILGENVNETENETSETAQYKVHNKTQEESEFPTDLFTKEERKKGAIILHCVLAVYCFLTIATVCTEFFMPTIQRLCEVLKLSDDVAAATFMSIATSSPELFTNIIGTFVTNSDIGVGHVLGNAYYDMFFVAFLGGIAASENIVLDWWPIARDCGIYLVVAVTLTGIVWDGEVEAYETIILLALYVLYFVIMFSNRAIIRMLKKFNINVIDPVNEINTNPIDLMDELEAPSVDNEINGGAYKIVSTTETNHETNPLADPRQQLKSDARGRKGRYWRKVGKLLILPINIATAITIPDVRKPKFRNLYPISFVICVCWIGVSTYLGTWMISVIGNYLLKYVFYDVVPSGETIGVPDIIMGMVFMAAGGSVVEAYGVYYKTRRGECSIGFSNSMGCNTLDATMCLALPWLVKIMLNKGPGSSAIMLTSDVLHINCGLLIISVVVMFGILYISKFTLNWKMGICSGVAYATVLTIAIAVEANQLGFS